MLTMFPVYLRKLIPGYIYGGTRSGSASERTLLATREKDTVNWNGNREIYQSACKRRKCMKLSRSIALQ